MSRPLRALIDADDAAWPEVERRLLSGANRARIVSASRARGEGTLHALQVSSRSTLGAIALETESVVLDGGWLRLLGAGGDATSGLLEWNGLGGRQAPDPVLTNALMVAHDAVGGFFAVNGGAFADGPAGGVFYFAPDTLQWEDLDMGYSAFVDWAADGDLERFYETMRWESWQDEIAAIGVDEGISVYPFLWASGEPVGQRSRRVVSIRELWTLQWHQADQVGRAPDRTSFDVVAQTEPSSGTRSGRPDGSAPRRCDEW